MPSKCQWSTLSHYSPIEQHQVPSPKNNHHHNNKPVCRKHINSLGDVFVLRKDNNTIAHTQSPLHTTLHSWENGVHSIIFWMFLKENWDKRAFLPYANIIKRSVYWKQPQESWWLPAAVPPQTSFCASTCFISTLSSISMSVFYHPLILLRRMFQVFSQKRNQVIIMVMVITWPVLLARRI